MIVFKSISFKNFLSTGNQPTKINLDKYITTIVTGKNGNGKSTFIDALVYGLFGKAFRKIRLGQLINNVNQGELLVEVEFSIGSKQYLVRRGQKPAVFEIFVNGEMIPQPAETKDYQKILENEILKLNHRTFNQIIVLGSASFVPFMQLKLGERREVIENILDISVFSEMNELLKHKIKDTDVQVNESQHKLDLKKSEYNLKREFYEKHVRDSAERKESLNKLIAECEESIVNAQDVVKLHQKTVAELDKKIAEYGDVHIQNQEHEDKITALQQERIKLQREIDRYNDYIERKQIDDARIANKEEEIELLKKRLADINLEISVLEIGANPYRDKDYNKKIGDLEKKKALTQQAIIEIDGRIRFYEEHQECPECKQTITQKFIQKTQRELAAKKKENSELLDNLNGEIAFNQQQREDGNKIFTELAQKTAEKREITTKIESLTAEIEEIVGGYESARITAPDQERIVHVDNEIVQLKELGNKLREQYNEVNQLKAKRNEAQKQVAIYEQSVKNQEANIVVHKKAIENMPECDVTEEILQDYVEFIKRIDKEIAKQKHLLHYYGIVRRLLKDDGIKSKIIAQYIPVINATVNMYLDRLSFPINFQFDENFNESIQSSMRDEFSYYNFSEGEKARIDLALLFTWRDIALKKSRNSTNILIFDEIFDGSLDVDGVEGFMDILGVNEEKFNSIVISHKNDTINGRFDRILEFRKDGHFSILKESF